MLTSSERKKLEQLNLNLKDFEVSCDVVNEDTREEALFKISAKHVDGIKTWSATDKRVFYHNLYTQYRNKGLSSDEALAKIKNITPEGKVAIRNDFDRAIYAMWYSILHDTEAFIKKVVEATFTIEEWDKQQEIQKKKDSVDLLTLGFSTFYLNRTNRSGIIQAGPIGGRNQTGNYKMNCRYNTEVLVKKIELIAKNKNRISLYNLDAIKFIKNNIRRTRRSLTFFDP
ncbi:TPA: hypothetical protein ACGO30_002290, partial [Streptococcus suis]